MSRVRPCLLWRFLVLLFGLFSPLLSAFAQDIAMADQQEVIEVPDVVVSATKTPQAPKQVTSAVEVITGEEMQQRKIRTVVEALRWAQVLGVPSVLIADALADAVRTLARVGAAGRGDPNRLAGSLGMPPWKIRKAQQQVRHWSPGALADAFAVAAEVNADVKGAAADVDYALERAVLRICAARGR